ncbi:MAG: UDP-N-acetylglucosamine 1-carboxyvinyltransferase [Coriobacteriales bacterium]|jgi:UDP-N-acetylglucosamine 1-carboxyvinyltransferase|nr:UDP-N-acetylglucosamine 1-carboxyvinyltransferase [Coriobacteriales bacterium]
MRTEPTIIIHGGRSLSGAVKVEGAKNSALKLMAACLLCPGQHSLHNVPQIADTKVMADLLRGLGAQVKHDRGRLEIDSSALTGFEAPYELVSQMRASTAVLGPLLARTGRAKVAMPGGCQIGSRKLDMHIRGLEAMGARFELEHGYMDASAPANGLGAAHIRLPGPSVGATENLLMAATCADGVTTLENCAREPEIGDLVHFLQRMGAPIDASLPGTLKITGGARLHPVKDYEVVGDRIEACTYIAAGALCGGPVTVTGVDPDHLRNPLQKLSRMGVQIVCGERSITVARRGRLAATTLQTLPYPGFPTDAQSFFMVLCSLADGESRIEETIFENRFMLADELNRMGARVSTYGNIASIKGVTALSGAPVQAPDLRGGAALVLAGLVAEGDTIVSNVHHIDRGYQDLCAKLTGLGAKVRRIG